MSLRGLFTDLTGGSMPLQRATVTLTDAQVKALPTTGITLVSAPGAGYQLVPWFWVLRGKFTAGAYTNVNASGYLYVEYASAVLASGYLANDATTTPALTKLTTLTGAANSTVQLHPYLHNVSPESDEWGLFPSVLATGDLENTALRIKVNNNGGGNFTGGNSANTLIATTYYTVEAV